MILDVAVLGSLLLLVWRLVAWALPRVERWGEPEDPFAPPTRQERDARQRRALWRALLPCGAPWLAWIPMLVVAETTLAIAGLLAAGVGLALAASLLALSWRPLPGLVLFGLVALLLVVPLVLFAGLAAEARLDAQALAQRSTVVELRRLGRAWWEWSEAARAAPGVGITDAGDAPARDPMRETDAALLLADRALGWPGLRGLPGDGRRLVAAAAYPKLDPRDVEALLAPTYLPRVPLVDGWGRPLEIRGWLEARDPGLPRFLVRSAGADGSFEGVYEGGAFPAQRAAADIVWADGAFLREPDPALPPE